MKNKWMIVKEVSQYLRVSTDLIYKLAQQGIIPASKIASSWRFDKEEIDRWMKDNRGKGRKRK